MRLVQASCVTANHSGTRVRRNGSFIAVPPPGSKKKVKKENNAHYKNGLIILFAATKCVVRFACSLYSQLNGND